MAALIGFPVTSLIPDFQRCASKRISGLLQAVIDGTAVRRSLTSDRGDRTIRQPVVPPGAIFNGHVDDP